MLALSLFLSLSSLTQDPGWEQLLLLRGEAWDFLGTPTAFASGRGQVVAFSHDGKIRFWIQDGGSRALRMELELSLPIERLGLVAPDPQGRAGYSATTPPALAGR